MDIATSLGINWKLLIGEIINFLVLLFILNKLVFKPLLKMMNERQKKIERGINQAAESEKRLKEISDLTKEIEQKTRKEANKLIDKGKENGQKERDRIIAQAKEDGIKLQKEADTQIAQEHKKALASVQSEVLEMSKKLAGAILHQAIGEKEDKTIIDKAFAKLNSESK